MGVLRTVGAMGVLGNNPRIVAQLHVLHRATIRVPLGNEAWGVLGCSSTLRLRLSFAKNQRSAAERKAKAQF